MKYFIKTFGCQMNYSDSERIAGLLEKYKLKPASNINAADLVIFNTCGVRQTAEDRAYGQIHNIAKRKTHSAKRETLIILTGCLAYRPDVQRRLKDKVDLFVAINDIKKFENWIIENSLEIGNWKLEIPADKKNSKGKKNINYLSIKPRYQNNRQAFVPIMTGCNNFCSYCVVPYARGREISRPAEEIISEISELAKKNYKEIILLGQNVNSYCGISKTESKVKKTKFPELLNYLAKKFLKINFKFLTSHPKDFSDKLISIIAKNDNISREIHLPVQSGSNKILKMMNRPYTKKYYLDLIKKAREKIPGAVFTTDVIVGFPGESEKDFQETMEVFKKVGYNKAYINKYSPRPGTAAFSLGDPIPWKEKKRREKILRKLVKRNPNPLPLSEGEIKRGCPRNKIIVILGPTASGKSSAAIKLAKKFGGEIISADSRQIYRGLDIGAGKIKKQEARSKKQEKFMSGGIVHYMIDIASPRTDYNAAKFKKKAEKIIQDISKRNKLPIICGGSGFWIKAVVDDVQFPEVKPNKALRKKLEKLSAEKLFKKLKKLDLARAKTIDSKNKVRLIRAIEICETLGKVPRLRLRKLRKIKGTSFHDREKMSFLQIGIKHPKKVLRERIRKNISKRFKQGMIAEVEKLHKDKKLSWKKIQSFGLAYYWIPLYLQNKISRKELAEKIYLAEKNYAKRQMTWFQKDKRIKWLENYKEIEREVKRFLEQ